MQRDIIVRLHLHHFLEVIQLSYWKVKIFQTDQFMKGDCPGFKTDRGMSEGQLVKKIKKKQPQE